MIIWLIAFLIIVLLIIMFYQAHHDVIDNQTIHDTDLPDDFNNFRVFFISDIHRRKINCLTLKKMTEQVDIVAIGGDLTEKGVPLARTRDNIRKLKKFNAPIYFVWGNNDYEVNTEKLRQLLLEENVTILEDAYEEIKKSTATLYVLGFDYYRHDDSRKNIAWDQIKGYTILLTHVPNSFYMLDKAFQKLIHTVLSGHTHGGQIRFLGLGLYRRGGMRTFHGTNVLISEGYGYTMLPFRFQTKAECHLVTFKNNKKH